MNKKTFSVAVTLLLVVMVVASIVGPAQAFSYNGRKKIPVTITREAPVGEIVEICTKGALYVVKAKLGFTTYIVEGDGIDLEKQPGPLGTTTYRLNSITGEGIAISEVYLDFGGGTFKGIIITRGVFGVMPSGPMAGLPFPLDVTQKGVSHGDGDYLGWTLVIEFTTGDPIEAYLLVPH
jgi:hypothetical protein